LEEEDIEILLPMKKPAADLNGEAGQTGRQFVKIRENSWTKKRSIASREYLSLTHRGSIIRFANGSIAHRAA